MVIGKSLGWEMVYCFRAGQLREVAEMFDFLERTNTHDLLAEAFVFDRETATWRLNDPGNGEQACWWTWSMVVIRKKAGLPALPLPQ